MSEELADCDRVLAVLCELGPVVRDPLFVVEPASRMRDRHRHRRQPLRGGIDDDHGAGLPGLACLLVSDSAPEIDDLLTAVIDTTRAAQLSASSEVLGECVVHSFEAATGVSFDGDVS